MIDDQLLKVNFQKNFFQLEPVSVIFLNKTENVV